MAKDVNLTSQEWCELIFEGKNQKYGAYYLRKTSSKRHIRAMIIVLIACGLIMLLPLLIKQVFPKNQLETIQETVTMANLGNIKHEPKQVQEQVVQDTPPPQLKAAIKYTPPVIDASATDEEIKTVEEVTQSKALIFSENIKGSDDPDAIDPSKLVKIVEVAPPAPKKQEILDYVEIMPSFPDGEAALNKFLKDKISYPAVAAEAGISGRVTLRFAVMEDGSISHITVLKSVHSSLDQEAIRVVKLMPKWIPGRQNNVPVPVYFILPVTFNLQNQ